MNRRWFLSLVLAFVCFLAVPAARAAEAYYCPMKCEGEKTYAAPGTCPICRMDLVKHAPASAAAPSVPEYRVDLSVDPKSPKAGTPIALALTPKHIKSGAVVRELEVVHEKPMHLIAVSQDLSWFAHWHPEVQPDGNLKVSATFPHGGNYVLYADFTPKGASNQVIPLAVTVEGNKTPVSKLKESTGSRKLDGFDVSLALLPAPKAGGESELSFLVKKKGKPVTDLEPYLGAMGHTVLVSEDTTRFLHVHPMSGGTGVRFHAKFPKAGLYKTWFEFKHGGKVRAADFVIRAK